MRCGTRVFWALADGTTERRTPHAAHARGGRSGQQRLSLEVSAPICRARLAAPDNTRGKDKDHAVFFILRSESWMTQGRLSIVDCWLLPPWGYGLWIVVSRGTVWHGSRLVHVRQNTFCSAPPSCRDCWFRRLPAPVDVDVTMSLVLTRCDCHCCSCCYRSIVVHCAAAAASAADACVW